MDLLCQSDIDALLEFTRDCYAIREFRTFDEFIRDLVAALARLIPAGHVTYNEMYPQDSKSYSWVNSLELGSPKANCLWEQHMMEHPVMRHVLATDDRRAVRISDFWSQRQLHDRGLYSDFYRLYNIEDALCITVPCQAPVIIGAGWHRDRCFSDRERILADLVRPHITQAWQNAKLVIGIQNQLHLLNEGLNDAPEGAIACDAEGHVQFMSASARRYLVEYFCAHNLDRRLPPELWRWVEHQNAQLLNHDVPLARRPLTVVKGGKRLTVRLLSDPGAPQRVPPPVEAVTDLLLLEEEAPIPKTRESPASLSSSQEAATIREFRLSQREREVLAWVAQGKTNGEIATILGRKLGTVRKHLEHIFQKLGVETRTAAAMAFQALSAKG
ncbi:MAG: helix-turn-helix transcriptional regulator [Terriglobia bacterium]